VGSSEQWRRHAYGGGIFFHTCAQHLPAEARSRDGAPPADSCEEPNT
jgi:hypothetical protein